MAISTITNTTLVSAFDRPESEDPWYAALEYPDGTVVVADSLTELVGSMIPFYETLPAAQGDAAALTALDARFDFVYDLATTQQAFFAAILTESDEFDVDAESEETLTAIFSDRDQIFPTIELWGHAVPLVLISTDYAPFTDLPMPSGNIKWLNPHTDLTLLLSLEGLGLLRLHIQADEEI